MSNDYNIFEKILFVFTTINNPHLVLFDKLGVSKNILYRTYSGVKFITRSRTSDINEAISILSGKEYPESILAISSKKNPIVIDAGAHIGLFSLFVTLINHSAKVYAIEPYEKNIGRLNINMNLNKIKGVKILHYALSDKKGIARLWYSGNKFDMATISLSRKRKEEEYLIVKSETLRGIISRNYIEIIDVLKMDIEGLEYKVIKKDIKQVVGKVKRLLIEYHTDSDSKMREKIIDLLVKNNFRIIFEHRHILGFLNESLNKS